MVGGMCSLLGTSVNLVAASLLENYDAKQKIGLFEFFGVGAVICVFTIFYIAVAAWHLLPREVRKSNDESENLTVDEHRQYLASFILSKESVYLQWAHCKGLGHYHGQGRVCGHCIQRQESALRLEPHPAGGR
jgi:cbb3-type cytochrome oxidase subunit 3